jgi:hypothetical protein
VTAATRVIVAVRTNDMITLRDFSSSTQIGNASKCHYIQEIESYPYSSYVRVWLRRRTVIWPASTVSGIATHGNILGLLGISCKDDGLVILEIWGRLLMVLLNVNVFV